MKTYRPNAPRKVFAFAAIAVTALTIGTLVVAPAQFNAVHTDAPTLARITQVVPAATEVAIEPGRIEVVAVREQKTAFQRFREFVDKRMQAG